MDFSDQDLRLMKSRIYDLRGLDKKMQADRLRAVETIPGADEDRPDIMRDILIDLVRDFYRRKYEQDAKRSLAQQDRAYDERDRRERR